MHIKKDILLYIDDEAENLLGFKVSFSNQYEIFTTTDIKEAYSILKSNCVKVLIVDYKMSEKDGIAFILDVKKEFPDIVFLMISAHADIDLTIEAINCNSIYNFIQKPWRYEELKVKLRNAVEKYDMKYEKKELIKQLTISLDKERKANEVKESFLRNISHEIRTPLNAILGFSEIAKTKTKDTELIDLLGVIGASGEQLLKIVEDFIDSSLIISQQLLFIKEEFSLVNLIHEILLKKKKEYFPLELNVDVNISKELIVETDKTKMEKILCAIIDNAYKFSNHNEKLIISTIEENNSEKISINITNTGSTISKQKIEHIFAPFTQLNNSMVRDKGGNGLGLFIAKSFIEFIGGNLRCISGNNSTSFFIDFNKKCSLNQIELESMIYNN